MSAYLLDQVFNSQPDEIQEFLLKTATFDQFFAPLLSEAFGFEQSEAEIRALLERIEAAQLFLTPLDSQRFYYRFHHLFRQMLLARQHFYFPPEQIFTAKDDYLPQRLHEAFTSGPLNGVRVDPETFQRALRLYHQMEGWDPETGWPTFAKLAELGIEWAAIPGDSW